MIQKYSFKDFLTKEVELINNDDSSVTVKIDKIEIPMIQRDYAQGRKNYNVEKRGNRSELNTTGEKFINELIAALSDSSQNSEMELDFVYGSIKEMSNGNQKLKYFYPLDGQQRLTTLFLLYWFIGGVELDSQGKKELSDILCNFYYATRTSSNVFCEKLVSELNGDTINFLLRTGAEPKETLVTQIENLAWFHNSYKLDPTVSAMLNMLNRIQELYIANECSNIFANLEKLRFYILPLSNFDLTEDLYVKMNARGKQLTSFENFKADLQHWIKDNAQKLGFTDKNYAGRSMPYDMYFINKMDNEWAQCFWDIKKDDDDKNYDPIFLSFIYRYWLNDYILRFTGTNKGLDKESDFVLLSEEPEYLGFALFERYITKDMVEYLERILDTISTHYKEIIDAIHPCWILTEDDRKFNLLGGKLELKDRVAFCALMLYFKSKQYDKDSLADWMHIVWNIIENANIDSWRVAAGVMQLIEELVIYSDDIYTNLASDLLVIKSLQSKDTMEEERLKARLICADPNWKKLITEVESHQYFKGSISFLIPDNEDINDFKHNFELAKIFFDDNGISAKYKENDHLFLRALISRYTSLADIKYHITDTREKENALKSMLMSDSVVRSAIKEWFALTDEASVKSKLESEVTKASPISIVANDFDKKIHEALYKETDLINWMQDHRAVRFRDGYVSRPVSQRDWVYVYGYRNEIIKALVDKGWKCDNRCYIDVGTLRKNIDYFWSPSIGAINLTKNEMCGNDEILLTCSIEGQSGILSINADTKVSFNYHDEVTSVALVPAFVDKVDSWYCSQLASQQVEGDNTLIESEN